MSGHLIKKFLSSQGRVGMESILSLDPVQVRYFSWADEFESRENIGPRI